MSKPRSSSVVPVLVRETRGWTDDTDIDDAKPRQFTDSLCFLLFTTMVVLMGYMYSDARSNGDIRKLLHGIDWMGQVCGVDPNVTDKPMLYWCVSEGFIAKDGICVDKCPTASSTSHLCPGMPSQIQRITPLEHGEYRVAVTVERSVSEFTDSPSKETFGMYCLADNAAYATLLATVPQLQGAVEHAMVALKGIYQNSRLLMFVALGATALSFGLLCFLAVFIEAVVCVILVIMFLLLLGSSLWFCAAAFQHVHNPFLPFTDAHHAKTYALALSGTFGIACLLYSVALCCLHESFELSFFAIRKATRTIRDLPTLVLAPFVQLVIKAAALLALLLGMATVMSLAKIRSPPLAAPNDAGILISGVSRSLEFEDWQWRWVIVWVLGSIWVQETVAALGQYAIAHAVVMYVLNKDEVNRCIPLTMGFINGAVYHLGTLAFGGFIIGVISLVSTVCSFLAKRMRDTDGHMNWTAKAACCCCTCCLEFMESIMRLSNELAYVDTAIFGSNYPEAAWQVFHLVARYPDRFATAKWIAKFIQNLCIIAITAGGTMATYLVVRKPDEGLVSSLHSTSILGTTVAAGVICFTLSGAFMVTFDMLVNVHVYCALIQEDKYNIPFGTCSDDGAYRQMAALE